MQFPPDAVALPSSAEVGILVETLTTSSPDFEILLRRYGDAAPALRHLGIIQWQTNVSRSVDLFRSALSLIPTSADLWRELANAYEATQEFGRARACIGTSLHYEPASARSWILLANLDSREGRYSEAEAAFLSALALDPKSGDAHFGLGLVYFACRKTAAAVTSFETAIANGYANVLGHTMLGHAQFLGGRFAAASTAFRQASALGDLDASTRRKFVRAQTFQRMIEADVEQAMRAYPGLAGAEAEEPDVLLRDAFALLSAHDYTAAALAVGRARLLQNPGDPTQLYLLDAVGGHTHSRAPVAYLESFFDQFASTFDDKLVNILHYKVPERLADLLRRARSGFATMLDLGCGTGLAANCLAAFGGRVMGVDVSQGMLDEARKRNVYTDLVKADIHDYLNKQTMRFDLIFAADVLIYFGDLGAIFEGVADALSPGGIFAFSIETMGGRDFEMLSSGRFAQSSSYIERLSLPHFKIVARETVTIRLEANRPADGILFLLERC